MVQISKTNYAFFIIFFLLSYNSFAQSIDVSFKLIEYECDKKILTQVCIKNNFNKTIIIDKCIEPKYIIDNKIRFIYSISDSSSTIYPATSRRIIDLTNRPTSDCLMPLKPGEIFKFDVDFISDFKKSKMSKTHTYDIRLTLNINYYIDSNKKYNYFNNTIFTVNNNICRIFTHIK